MQGCASVYLPVLLDFFPGNQRQVGIVRTRRGWHGVQVHATPTCACEYGMGRRHFATWGLFLFRLPAASWTPEKRRAKKHDEAGGEIRARGVQCSGHEGGPVPHLKADPHSPPTQTPDSNEGTHSSTERTPGRERATERAGVEQFSPVRPGGATEH